MKLRASLIRNLSLLALACSFLTLVACTTHKKPDEAAINDANEAYRSSEAGAQASGVGEYNSFADETNRTDQFSRRIYYFDFDRYTVHDEDKPAILANASYLLAHPTAKVLLEGHTDPRGSREYNIGLGERRAKAVADILTARGVNPAQVRIVSYGAEKLAVIGHTEADYQQDRRVVLVYLQR